MEGDKGREKCYNLNSKREEREQSCVRAHMPQACDDQIKTCVYDGISFFHVSTKAQTQIIRFGAFLYKLGHLASLKRHNSSRMYFS